LAIMYNPEQKQEYIDSETNEKIRASLKRYFVRVESGETKYDKDIANMSFDELKETIESLGIRREESRGHLLSLLRGYVNWAVLNGKANNSVAINSITAESIDSQELIRKTMIKDPEHLKLVLDSAMDREDYANRSMRDELIFWLLYCGMTLEEILPLKKNDLNAEKKTITLENERYYDANDEVLRLWPHVSNITFIEKKNGKGNVEEYTEYELVDNDYLFRSIRGSKADESRKCSISMFRSILLNALKGKDKTIPARNIKYSGIFYKIYLLESSGTKITPDIIAKHFWIDSKSKSDLLMKTRKWRIDYDDWKSAFGYNIAQ